jgi:hypothetical protein
MTLLGSDKEEIMSLKGFKGFARPKIARTVLDAWLNGLVSGAYKRGTGSFVSEEADGSICHCVEGVLADVMGFKPVRFFEMTAGGRKCGAYHESEAILAPPEVTDLTRAAAKAGDLTDYLWMLNDQKGYTFAQLHAVISENQHKMFIVEEDK